MGNTTQFDLEGKVGAVTGGDGSRFLLRQDKTGSQVVTDAHGRYREAVSRGRVFSQAVKSATVTVTTDISPLPATTGRALLGIINPAASGFTASVLKIGISTVSGTPGGPLYIDVVPNAGVAATLAASSAPINVSTFQAAGSAMRGLAAAVPAQAAVATLLRPLGGPAAIAAGVGLYHIEEDVGGSIELPQNSILVVTAHATGTSHVISGYIVWEEIPVI